MEWLFPERWKRRRSKTMGNGSMEGNKWEKFGRGTIEQRTRMLIKDWAMVQDFLNRNYIYIYFYQFYNV